MSADQSLIAALRALDPNTSPDPAAYLPRQAAAGRPWNQEDQLRLLVQSGGRQRILLHGCAGIGKSTELRRWRSAIPQAVLVALSEPSASPASVVVQVLRAAAPHIPLSELHRTPGVAQFAAVVGGTEVPPTEPRPLPELRDILDKAAASSNFPSLILIDGLELTSAKQAIALLGSAGAFSWPGWPSLVVSVPHAWALSGKTRETAPHFEISWHLPPIALYERRDSEPDEALVEAIANGLRQRLGPALGAFDHPDAVAHLARLSGGVPRHAVLLARQAVLAAAGSPSIGDIDVASACREVRQDLREALGKATEAEPSLSALVSGAVLVCEGRETRFNRLHPLLS